MTQRLTRGSEPDHRQRPTRAPITAAGDVLARLGHAARSGGVLIPRIVAAGAWICGAVSLGSSLLPAEHGRLRIVERVVNSAVPSTAAGTTAAVGLGLMMLAGGLRRRQRRAWVAAVALTVGALVLHLLKGLDVEEAAMCAALVGALLVTRGQFTAAAAVRPRRPALLVLGSLVTLDVGVGLALIRANDQSLLDSPPVTERMEHVLLGFAGVRGPLHFGDDVAASTVSAVLAGLGAMTMLAVVVALLVRPREVPARTPEQQACLERLLACHGEQDSLAWFAGRDDRQLICSPSSKAAVSYRVIGGVALAAGDPLGDPEAWPLAIEAFLVRARASGWVPGVLGCGARAGAAWKRAGLDVVELGEEAIVEIAEFSLEGRSMRGVRQACGRVDRAGYRFEVRRCGELDPAEWAELSEAATRWRQGGVERGFSMALGRFGDPRDAVGVVATARDADGRLRALLQFVPWGSDGLSLDVMRRDPSGDNGIQEALIVAVIGYAGQHGIRRASLNFAMFRDALERGGRLGAGPMARAGRRVLVLGSKWWQIEQLARFNAKFEPQWSPRFLCYPGAVELPGIGVAAARAEGFLVMPSVAPRALARCR